MGCICPKKLNNEDLLVLDLQYLNGESYIRKNSGSRCSKEKSNSALNYTNKSNFEMDDGYDLCNKTSIALLETCKTKKKEHMEIFIDNMLKEINDVRTNPNNYAEKVRAYTKNIMTDEKGQEFFCMEFNSKIILPRGKKAFENCIEYLQDLRPLEKLEMVEELKLPFPMKTPELAAGREYITTSLFQKAQEQKDKYIINWFHYDNNILNAEISVVLQLVDDNNSNGQRRKHLLDDKVKYVGINVGHVRKNIHCIYIVFAS